MSSVELSDLVGEHTLTCVDEFTDKVKETWGDGFEDCEACNFTLDGVTYSAIEDPSDGYRSSMRELKVSHAIGKNVFPAQTVVGHMMADSEYGEKHDVLVLTDVVTGKVVLKVGTESTDDYYPSFVNTFTPENMAINKGRV